MFHYRMLVDRLFTSVAALGRFARSSPATVAKAAYLLAFAVVISLLIDPGRSRGQFRGVPAVPAFPLGIPFATPFPMFGAGFTGFQTAHFVPPAFPGLTPFFGMPGPMPMFPLTGFGTGSIGFFGFPFFPAFGNASFGVFGSPFGFRTFGSFNLGNGLGMGGFGGFGGFSGMGISGGFGGGFAGKGFGGFSGRKGL